MNYKKIYNNLIESRRVLNRFKSDKTYFELHHILPVSFGGTNEKFNMILLTAKEHWIAHLLLTKFSTGENKYKSAQAIINMGRVISKNKRKTSILYESARKVIALETSKRHTGTLIVKDKNTDIRIGRVSKNHPKVLSGEWIFFHCGMTRTIDWKNKVSVSVSGEKNGTYSGISNKEILNVCCEIFEKYNRWSMGFTRRYFKEIYKKELPKFMGNKFRNKVKVKNIEKFLISKYKIKDVDLLNPHKMRKTII